MWVGGGGKWKNPNVSFKVVISSKRKREKEERKSFAFISFTKKGIGLLYGTTQGAPNEQKIWETRANPGRKLRRNTPNRLLPRVGRSAPRAARRPTPPSPLLGPARAGRSVWRPLPGRQGGRGGGGEEGKS